MAFANSTVGADKYTGFSYEGKPIVVTKKPGTSLRTEKTKKNYWPEEERIEAATLWAAVRDFKTVSALTKIPEYTLKKWKTEPWFGNVVSRVLKDHNDVLDTKLTDVIGKCAELLQDRLTAGDIKINYKTGEVYTAPLDARGLALVMGIIFDKRQLIRGEATSRTETISSDTRLQQLRDAFESFSKAKQIEGEVITDAIEVSETSEDNEGSGSQSEVGEEIGDSGFRGQRVYEGRPEEISKEV